MKRILFFIAAVCCIAACDNEDNPSGDGVKLRVENISDRPFDEVLVRIGGKEHMYGSLDTGAVSSYAAFDFCYAYAYTEVVVGNDTAIIQPIDFVGERKYAAGTFTYQLFFTDFLAEEEYLTIQFVRD
ncbi:MAG: hypothetical protein AAF824_15845 [Bacteroidota bacterium]